GKGMKNYDKALILNQGEWRPTVKSKEPGLYSYHLNSLISPVGLYSWEKMVIEWSKCWDLQKNKIKDIERYRTFRNTDQGLPFAEKGEQIRREKVREYKSYQFLKNQINNEKFKLNSESEILLLTAAVDVQKNNLFCHIIGWTYGGRNYTIDFLKIDGITENNNSESWKKLDELLINKIWTADDGKQYKIIQTVIDSGHYTDYVYAFCKRYSAGVFAVKGDEKIGKLTYKEFNNDTMKRTGLPVAYHINTTMIKDRIARMFNLRWETEKFQEEWYVNFPEDMRDDEMDQFEAEEKINEYDKITNKWIRSRWRLIPGRENHFFDCMCYNIANLEILADYVCRYELDLKYLDWKRFWDFCKTGIFYIDKK
ncbi:MAG TPA: terminase gpA endonuclease subunit, partial [Candidatus Lokiarchaeia archaeon]